MTKTLVIQRLGYSKISMASLQDKIRFLQRQLVQMFNVKNNVDL